MVLQYFGCSGLFCLFSLSLKDTAVSSRNSNAASEIESWLLMSAQHSLQVNSYSGVDLVYAFVNLWFILY